MLESGLISLLKANAGVSSLVATRMYPVLLPDKSTLPAVTYRTLSSLPTYTLTGALGMTTNRIEYTAWATSYLTAKAIIEAIVEALDNYTGTLADGTFVSRIWRTGSAVDSFEAEGNLYTCSIDFRITYTE